MTIESIAGRRKFRISPDNNLIVQVQEKHRGRWEDYRRAESWTEASKLVLVLAMARDETQEMEAVQE